MKTKVEGADIKIEVSGSGRVLLLLHAFPLGLSMWDPQAEALSPTYRIARFDARGFGGSALGTEPFTMEQIADDAAAILDALAVAKAVVGGCSMGGYAALAFVRRHPRRLAGLILQDTRAAADTEEAKLGRTALAARVLAEGAEVAVEAFLPKLLGRTSLRTKPALVTLLRERIRATPREAIAAALAGLAAREDSRPTLGAIQVPTLVLVGEEDVLTPPAEAEAMAAAIPGARLEKIPNAGHLANIENPEAVNAALGTFLTALPQ
jgi:pimeloyl-ACP methyl ester carboxylesterase